MTAFPDEPWSVGQGSVEGRPLFVRVNTGAAAIRGEPSLRTRVGITVPLQAPDDEGLPDAREMSRLSEIEDSLGVALGVGARTVHVLVITTSGVREFVYHTTASAEVQAAVDAVATQFPDYELELDMEDDADWSVYSRFQL